MRLVNNSQRAFIVKKASVKSGGRKITGSKDMSIEPGQTVDVTEECAKFLSKYLGVQLIDSFPKKPKDGKK